MTAHALVTGALFRSPEQRNAKSGKPFVTVTLRVTDRDEPQWWKVVTFSESAQAELMQLAEGDAISCQGPLRVETYEKDGVTKLSFTVVADQVLPLRQPPKKREAKVSATAPDARSRQERQRGAWASENDGPNDAIPEFI